MSDNPRGLRNQNPGNIIYSASNQWNGQTGQDGRYATFSSPEYGIRAMVKILDAYQRRGVDTVSEIITTWAPESDNNDTLSYIKSVCQRTGFEPNFILNALDYPLLIDAIIYHENGEQPYLDEVIEAGIGMAG